MCLKIIIVFLIFVKVKISFLFFVIIFGEFEMEKKVVMYDGCLFLD